MDEQTNESRSGAARPVMGFVPPSGGAESVQQELRGALECAARDGAKAVVIVVEVNPNYGRRAQERVAAVAANWERRHPQRLQVCPLGHNRFAIVAASIGSASQARALGQHFTRSLDPRICPLLRRALPYAWCGAGIFPDDGLEPEVLVARAEQALERMRNAGTRCRKLAPARRRPGRGPVLAAVPAR